MPRPPASAPRRLLQLFYNDYVPADLPAKHRFPMRKYFLVRSALQAELLAPRGRPDPATARLSEGATPAATTAAVAAASFHESPDVLADELCAAHSTDYVDRVLRGQLSDSEVRRIGLPVHGGFLRRSTTAVGGTLAATRAVMAAAPPGEFAVAGHVAGGTHHAYRSHGEGFCVFNDIAVAAAVTRRELPRPPRVLVVDLDVHQGNGTAEIFAGDDGVVTFSMHCSKNIFSRREASDHDVEVEPGCGDADYLAALREWLPFLFDTYRPELVFYQAGVDPFEHDQLGKLALTRQGLQQRNELVLEHARDHGSKLVLTLGGGYPKSLVEDSDAFRGLVDCHADVFRQAAHCLQDHVQRHQQQSRP